MDDENCLSATFDTSTLSDDTNQTLKNDLSNLTNGFYFKADNSISTDCGNYKITPVGGYFIPKITYEKTTTGNDNKITYTIDDSIKYFFLQL